MIITTSIFLGGVKARIFRFNSSKLSPILIGVVLRIIGIGFCGVSKYLLPSFKSFVTENGQVWQNGQAGWSQDIFKSSKQNEQMLFSQHTVISISITYQQSRSITYVWNNSYILDNNMYKLFFLSQFLVCMRNKDRSLFVDRYVHPGSSYFSCTIVCIGIGSILAPTFGRLKSGKLFVFRIWDRDWSLRFSSNERSRNDAN